MNALYLVVMLLTPKCSSSSLVCQSKVDVFFTYKTADAEKASGMGARVWRISPSLRVSRMMGGSDYDRILRPVKVK